MNSGVHGTENVHASKPGERVNGVKPRHDPEGSASSNRLVLAKCQINDARKHIIRRCAVALIKFAVFEGLAIGMHVRTEEIRLQPQAHVVPTEEARAVLLVELYET